tara:strand:+ start:221 stop:694 length:474 start_codon:yes stop_codon:yes gene_type:complete
MVKGYYRKRSDFSKYWWVNATLPGKDSAEINLSVANNYKSYGPLKASVWFLYRNKIANRKDLSSRDKLIAWAIAERYRGQSFSTWDSFTYLGAMIGMNRKTVAKGIKSLMDNNVIWIVLEGEEKVGLTKLVSKRQKKHIILCGLNFILAEEIRKKNE